MPSSPDRPKRAGSWKTIPTRRRSSRRSIPSVVSPSRKTSPAVGSIRRFTARRKVLLPAPEGPTTAVILPSGTSASTPLRISAPPTAYRSPWTRSFGLAKLERLPAQVGVEAVVEDIRVAGEGLVVGEGELHPPDDGVQALGLGASVLLVHQVGVVDDLAYLAQHGVFEPVFFEKGLEGAVVPAVA